MDELIDILDDKGNKIGEELKSVAHHRGLWHKSVHVIINNINSDMSLFQKRCSLKDLYPNKWDIAVGGHVGAKEEEINAAIRELKEELGITVNIDELKLINVVKENLLDNSIISNEFVYIYNESGCDIYNMKGVLKYTGDFEIPVECLIPGDTKEKMTLVGRDTILHISLN